MTASRSVNRQNPLIGPLKKSRNPSDFKGYGSSCFKGTSHAPPPKSGRKWQEKAPEMSPGRHQVHTDSLMRQRLPFQRTLSRPAATAGFSSTVHCSVQPQHVELRQPGSRRRVATAVWLVSGPAVCGGSSIPLPAVGAGPGRWSSDVHDPLRSRSIEPRPVSCLQNPCAGD